MLKKDDVKTLIASSLYGFYNEILKDKFATEAYVDGKSLPIIFISDDNKTGDKLFPLLPEHNLVFIAGDAQLTDSNNVVNILYGLCYSDLQDDGSKLLTEYRTGKAAKLNSNGTLESFEYINTDIKSIVSNIKGGESNKVLAKNSDTDFDYKWVDMPSIETFKKYVDEKFLTGEMDTILTIPKDELNKCNDTVYGITCSQNFSLIDPNANYIYYAYYGDVIKEITYSSDGTVAYSGVLDTCEDGNSINLCMYRSNNKLLPFSVGIASIRAYEFTNDLIIKGAKLLDPKEVPTEEDINNISNNLNDIKYELLKQNNYIKELYTDRLEILNGVIKDIKTYENNTNVSARYFNIDKTLDNLNDFDKCYVNIRYKKDDVQKTAYKSSELSKSTNVFSILFDTDYGWDFDLMFKLIPNKQIDENLKEIDANSKCYCYIKYANGTTDDIKEMLDNSKIEIILTGKKMLTLDNAAEYTPTKDYNPTTKKYVDDLVENSKTIMCTDEEVNNMLAEVLGGDYSGN